MIWFAAILGGNQRGLPVLPPLLAFSAKPD